MKTQTTFSKQHLAGLVFFILALAAVNLQAQLPPALAINTHDTHITTKLSSVIIEQNALEDWMFCEESWILPVPEQVQIEEWMFDSIFWHITYTHEWMEEPVEKPIKMEEWMFSPLKCNNTIAAFQSEIRSWVTKQEFYIL